MHGSKIEKEEEEEQQKMIDKTRTTTKRRTKQLVFFSACSSWNFLSNCTTCCFQPPITAEGWWTLTVSLLISLSLRRCLTWSAVLTSWLWRAWITEKNTASKLRSSSLCRARTAPAALWNASLPSDNTGMKIHSLKSHHRIMSSCLQGKDISSSCRSLPQMQIPATAQTRHICEKLLQVCVFVACTQTRWRVLLMTNNTAATKDHPHETSSIICHITIARGFEIEGGRGKKLLEEKSYHESLYMMTIITPAHPTLFTIFRSFWETKQNCSVCWFPSLFYTASAIPSALNLHCYLDGHSHSHPCQ